MGRSAWTSLMSTAKLPIDLYENCKAEDRKHSKFVWTLLRMVINAHPNQFEWRSKSLAPMALQTNVYGKTIGVCKSKAKVTQRKVSLLSLYEHRAGMHSHVALMKLVKVRLFTRTSIAWAAVLKEITSDTMAHRVWKHGRWYNVGGKLT